MITPSQFMLDQNFDLIVGVPARGLSPFLIGQNYKVFNNESQAVSFASGAYLSGKVSKPLVFMQNSGLFASSNEIASIVKSMDIPLKFLIEYRGINYENATQHLITGKHTESLLKGLGLEFCHWNDVTKNSDVFLVTKLSIKDFLTCPNNNTIPSKYALSRQEIVKQIIGLSKGLVVWPTGLTSRCAYEHGHKDRFIYNAGGFGYSCMIGLGIASCSQEPVIVVDGDGSATVNLSNLTQIAKLKRQFTYIILQNNMYESCSGEICDSTYLKDVVHSMGIMVYEELSSELLFKSLSCSCPTIFLIPMKVDFKRNYKRPLDMPLYASRFRSNNV